MTPDTTNARPHDEFFMRRALALAERAKAEGEVPIGAVLVRDGKEIAEGWNRPIAASDPTAHAEIIALRAGGLALENYRLVGCDLYVTVEPCTMCAGALVHARISRLIYGASEPRTGAVRTVDDLLCEGHHNHTVEVTAGVLATECASLMATFFAEKR